MKRKTRFSNGGVNPFQGDDVDPFSGARDEMGSTDPRKEGPSSEALYDETSGRELSTRRNLETGEYYSTEPVTRKAESATKAPPKAAKIGPSSGGARSAGRGGATAAEMAEYHSRAKSSKAEIPTDTAAKAPASTGESTSGMSNMDKLMAGIPAGMGATRFLQAGARGLANLMRAREAAKKAPEGAKQIGEGRKMLESPGKFKSRELEEKRAGRAARREKEVSRGIREKADDSGAIRLAKGGSASSRADGCAVRGKTRGKMY